MLCSLLVCICDSHSVNMRYPPYVYSIKSNVKFHNNHFKSSQSTIKHQVQSYIMQSIRTITKCMQQLVSYSDQENSSLGCHVIRCNCWLLHGTSVFFFILEWLILLDHFHQMMLDLALWVNHQHGFFRRHAIHCHNQTTPFPPWCHQVSA